MDVCPTRLLTCIMLGASSEGQLEGQPDTLNRAYRPTKGNRADPRGPPWGPPWGPLGAPWGPLGPLGPLGTTWGPLGPPNPRVRPGVPRRGGIFHQILDFFLIFCPKLGLLANVWSRIGTFGQCLVQNLASPAGALGPGGCREAADKFVRRGVWGGGAPPGRVKR